ncbi:hypothetical protein QVD17_18385 [Tagetes erecta]|uniref:Uncharacterized protein n=1 Tax=Tagetes erecta TaxID=13708 RepID=A0AAD8NWA5_TARER|nr:hypothetical protein QVD17_18385 [Tagetes erecta]
MYCEQSCPGGRFETVPYPFGFNSQCKIQLNCTSQGDVLIGAFTVHQINSDDILVSLPAKCGRPIHTLTQLYAKHYAPLSTNTILLENCTQQMETCKLPSLHTNCNYAKSGNGNMSCYSTDMTRMFLDYEDLKMTGCRFMVSAVAMVMIGDGASVSLDVEVIRLAWWLYGTCDDCSVQADCTTIVSPVDGSNGYQCKCKSGFHGDGYKGRLGCDQEGMSGSPIY